MRGGTRRRPTARRAIDIIDGPQHTTCDFSYLDVQFTRNFSHSDVNNASRSSHVLCPPVGDREEAPEHKKTEQEMELVRLEKGRWHILRVEGADHSLGTWASEKSDEMYRELVCLLDAHQRQRP